MEIKNLKKATSRIKKAVKNKEKIILYGDADLDGVTSVIILKETLKNLGGENPTVYFPDLEKEGYGLNKSALEFLKESSPALLLTLDCGISNFEEVKLAKSLGFEVVIIDHHEILDRLPKALIIVDPKQKGDKYPFKGLANVGIIYKLSRLLLKDRLSDVLKRNFLELVAIATIADMMPEEADNKIMIEQGLFSLENSWRPGLRAFFNLDEIKNYSGIRQIAQKIVSALNIAEVKNHLNETYLLLTSSSLEEAEKLAKELLEKRDLRQMEIKEITEEIEARILKKLKEPVVFEGDSSWSLALVGSAASKTCHRYQKPTFIFKKGVKASQGRVRTPSGINGVELMKKCSKYLLTYGGHPPAAGFTIKNENLEKFKSCLIENL